MSDLIDQFNNNKKFQSKITKQTKEHTPKRRKTTRKPKSVLIDYPLYKRLKIVSAEKDMQMKQIVALSLKAWFRKHI